MKTVALSRWLVQNSGIKKTQIFGKKNIKIPEKVANQYRQCIKTHIQLIDYQTINPINKPILSFTKWPWVACHTVCNWELSPKDTTLHVRYVKPMHFGCVELVKQHTSTPSTRRAQLAWHVRYDERDRRDSQLNLLCNLYKVITYKLFTNLLEYTFILFDGTNRIFVCKSIKATKLVQVSTIACSSSTMMEQHGSTRSSRLARHIKRVESCPDVTWRAKWNLGFSQ